MKQATILVVVDLWATGCGPWQTVTPVLVRVARDLAGMVNLVGDLDRGRMPAARTVPHTVPTLVLTTGGTAVAGRAGAVPVPATGVRPGQALGGRP
jgi:thioredoxin-like negative regulator of GroEL